MVWIVRDFLIANALLILCRSLFKIVITKIVNVFNRAVSRGKWSFPKLKIPHQSHTDFCSTDTAGGWITRKGGMYPFSCGGKRGQRFHLAHDFAKQRVVYYMFCRRHCENAVAAGECKDIWSGRKTELCLCGVVQVQLCFYHRNRAYIKSSFTLSLWFIIIFLVLK